LITSYQGAYILILNNKQKIAEPEAKISIPGIKIFICIIMVLVSLAMISHSPQDWNTLNGGIDTLVRNWIGPLGANISHTLLLFCGISAYLFVLLLLIRSLRVLLPGAGSIRNFIGGFCLVMLGTMLLLAISPEAFSVITHNLGLGHSAEPAKALSGGLIGQFFAAPQIGSEIPAGCLRAVIGTVGTMIVSWIIVTIGGVILYVSDWHDIMRKFVAPAAAGAAEEASKGLSNWRSRLAEKKRLQMEDEEEMEEEFPAEDNEDEQQELIELEDEDEEIPQIPRPSSGKKTAPAAGNKNLKSRLAAFISAQKAAENEDYDDDTAIITMNNGDDDINDDERTENISQEPAAGFNLRNRGIDQHSAAANMPSAPTAAAVMETPEVGKHVVQQGERLQGCRGRFVLPLVSMLAQGTNVVGENVDAIELAKSKIQQTLENFSIPGKVTGHVSGPRVTRYEITLEPGVNVKKVEQIQENISMELEAQSIRVLAPIPGRSVVGIEVSNSKPEAVFMRSIMESNEWEFSKAEIPLALGKNVSGKPIILDLAKAPHMLVAGATGTGKSVCSNSIITSLLFKFAPDELRLIMVDPKIVEFEAYKTLPHLLTPIINDSAKVPIALRWAANEMDNRYRILAKVGVKKLSEFNNRPRSQETEYDDDGNPIPEKMPYLVIILDELADLMMTEAKKDVETNIARIAQKGRAAGIHIIVATQRPDAKIVTGVIKANLPTRLCFQVRSLVDSRVVLDTMGAEKLLGMGDMLAMTPASMELERVQGAWVKDDDIKNVVKFVSDQAPQRFNDTVLAENSGADDDIDEELEKIDPEDRADIAPVVQKYLRPGDDDTMKRALEVVILDRKASTSYLQRRLKIGYNRAAELIEEMEDRGIVGPPSGSGNKREILIFDGIDIG
jgi:S-DNA-T family DNA segregation ATPase FtsK/SpoIIIE